MEEITRDIIKKVYEERPSSSKKYDRGLLIVIGGSQFYSGSPALTALGAFRAGVDMVRIIAPQRAADIIAGFSPVLAAFPLEGKCLTKKHLSDLLSLVESSKIVSNGKTAVVIGGGLGRSEETQEVIKEFLKKVSVPVVIDDDAIHAVAENPETVIGRNFLLTPHTYEFYILTKKEIYQLPEEEKELMVQQEAKKFGCTILLKGATDIISNGESIALSRGGTPHMAKGGAGDVLSGIGGALLARGCDVFDSACAASYINKKAAELGDQEFGEALLPTDFIEKIPEVIKIEA